MRQEKESPDEMFPDSFEGAVDVVFLLIIFFLVASSFSSEVKERVTLAKRLEPESTASPTPKPSTMMKFESKLRIVIYDDSTIKIDRLPLELQDPNSLELYYKIGEVIDKKLKQAEEADLPKDQYGRPLLDIQIWADKEAYSGITMYALMACLDKDMKPDVLFDKEMRPEELIPGAEAAKQAEEAAGEAIPAVSAPVSE